MFVGGEGGSYKYCIILSRNIFQEKQKITGSGSEFLEIIARNIKKDKIPTSRN